MYLRYRGRTEKYNPGYLLSLNRIYYSIVLHLFELGKAKKSRNNLLHGINGSLI